MGSERVCFHGLGRAKRASEASERSSLMLPLGFHGPLCMHCSAAVWCFSLLAAAALGASASAGLVPPCWKFWSLAVACFNNLQKCSRFPFSYRDRLFCSRSLGLIFCSFFRCRFWITFSSIFFDFGHDRETKMGPNVTFFNVLEMFFGILIFASFRYCFLMLA